MTSTPSPAGAATGPWLAQLRSWRSVVGLAAALGGAAVIAGSFLPWAEAFAGLVGYPGIDSTNGRVLAAAGAIMVTAGACHLIRGQSWSRWTASLTGFGALSFSGLLLLRLAGTIRSLGSDDMVILRGGPGLWVITAGALLAFSTLFLPSSAQQTLRARAGGAGLAAWAADSDSGGLRRVLQLGLGAIWMLDAALQFQPFMFGRGFVSQVIDPAAMGSPAAIANTATGAGAVILTHPALFNAGFAVVQLSIGVALLSRRTTRAGLTGTVVWGLAVWWLGEALGALFSGMADPLTGAPGAALMYVVVAVLAWPRPGGADALSVAEAGLLGRRWGRALWVVIWGGFAALMFQPQVRAPGALRDAIGGMASGHNVMAWVDRGAASLIGSGGHVPVLIFAVLFATIAGGIFLPPGARRIVLAAAAVLALAIWVVGENLGALSTGSATDPNTGPLLLLLIAAFWPARPGAGSADHEVGRVELAGAMAEVEGESRPQREVAALAVQVPAGAAGAPDRLR
jgi:hypothetical protein